MKRTSIINICIMAACICFSSSGFAVTPINDEQIKQRIIEESIAAYPGTCACPFNQARNGSRCGKRSAWSKAGGYSPICYASEVTPEMIKAWRAQRR